MDNWLLIIVAVIFLICIVVGAVRGFFRIGLSLLSSVLTIIIVIYTAPMVGDMVAKFTPFDEMVEEKCVELFVPEISADLFAGKDLTGTSLEYLSREELQNLGSVDWRALGIAAEDILDVIGDIPKEEQVRQVENSIFPEFVKEALLDNNNNAVYEELGVDSFPKYVASYISRMVIHILSFLVTFILAIIIVKALMAAVDIIGELPVIGTLNHIGGALLGALGALLIVWVIFLIVTLLYSTNIGTQCFEMIKNSQILTLLYRTNLLLGKLMSF